MYAWKPDPNLKHDCSVEPCPVCDTTKGPAMNPLHAPEPEDDEPSINGLCV